LQQNLQTLILLKRGHSTWWHGWLSKWEDLAATNADSSNFITATVLTSFYVEKRYTSKYGVQLHTWDAYAATTLFWDTVLLQEYLHPWMMKAQVTSRYGHESTILQPCYKFNSTYGLGCGDLQHTNYIRRPLPFNFILSLQQNLHPSIMREVNITWGTWL
jgi:hypothetical protein